MDYTEKISNVFQRFDEVKALYDYNGVLSSAFEELENVINSLEKNAYLATADDIGISAFEEALDIQDISGKEVEQRRAFALNQTKIKPIYKFVDLVEDLRSTDIVGDVGESHDSTGFTQETVGSYVYKKCKLTYVDGYDSVFIRLSLIPDYYDAVSIRTAVSAGRARKLCELIDSKVPLATEYWKLSIFMWSSVPFGGYENVTKHTCLETQINDHFVKVCWNTMISYSWYTAENGVKCWKTICK